MSVIKVAGAAVVFAVLNALLMPQIAAAGTAKCGLNNGKPATGEPIEIGAIVGKTGPGDFSGSAQAAAAYFACVNANGGINGRPVHYTVEDDQWNPETTAQLAAKLVNDVKVVGMVGNSSFVDCAANAKFYENNNVLVIAGVGVPRECFHSKNIAPTNGGPRMTNIGIAQFMHDDLHVKRLVCLAFNIPNVGDWACEGVAAYGKSVGMEVKTIPIDPGSMDAASLILQAMAFKPEAINVMERALGLADCKFRLSSMAWLDCRGSGFDRVGAVLWPPHRASACAQRSDRARCGNPRVRVDHFGLLRIPLGRMAAQLAPTD